MSVSTVFNLILQQGIGPVFTRSSNPALYPFILGALAVALFLFLREVLNDTRYYLRSDRPSLTGLRSDLLFDVGVLLGSWALIYGIWVCFTLPYNALPVLSAPVSGATIGPVSLHDLYYFLAVLLHLVVSFFALQLLAGVWAGYLKPRALETRQITDVASIISTAIVIFGWEAQRWPSAFTIPVEVFLAFSFALLLVRPFAPARASDRGLRFQIACIAILALAGVSGIWALHGIGLPADFAGLISRRANPALYPFALAAVGISLLAALVNGITAALPPVKRQLATQNAAGGMLLSWIIMIGLVWLAWWAITAPYAQLPFVSVNPSLTVASLRLDGAIAVVATLMHATVFALAISNLLTFWATSVLRIFTSSAGSGIISTLAFSLVAVVLHEMTWPEWVIVILELVILSVIIAQLDDWIEWLLKWRGAETSSALRRLQRFKGTLSGIVYFLIIAFIVLTNGSSIYLLEFFGLFYMLSLLDGVVSAFWSVVNHKKVLGPLGLLSPRRWYITTPLVMLIALVGAAGLFRAIGPAGASDYALWLEVGAAAAAYMVFKPLVTYANYGAANRSRYEEETLAPSEMIEKLVLALAQPASALATDAQARLGRLGVPGATSTRSDTTEKHSQREEIALGIESGLQLPIGVLFFLLALAYHLLTSYLHLTSLLNSSFVPLVFGLIALAASLLQVINVPAMDPPRYVSLMLVFIIIVVSGVTVLFTLAQLPPMLSPETLASSGFLSVVSNESYLANSVYILLRELLFLLTLGQLIYLFRLIETSLAVGQRAHQDDTREADGAQDAAELGEWLAERGERDKAIAQYRMALDTAGRDHKAIRRAGLGLQRQRQYADALRAYERAIELDPENAIYWNDKGVALAALQRPRESIAAYDRAIALNTSYALAWDNKGDEFMTLGSWEQALTAYRKAVELASSGDYKDVYWDDASIPLMNLRRYDEALDAVNQALKIDGKWAVAWRNKADILLSMPSRSREALAAAERSLGLQAQSIRGWALYGAALAATGQSSDAQIAFEHALALDQDPTGAWYSRAVALAGLGRYDEALAAAERAVTEEPLDPDNMRLKASILRAQGRTHEAEEAEQRERQLSAGTWEPR